MLVAARRVLFSIALLGGPIGACAKDEPTPQPIPVAPPPSTSSEKPISSVDPSGCGGCTSDCSDRCACPFLCASKQDASADGSDAADAAADG